MFVFYSVHYPEPDKKEFWIQKMRQFDELMKKQPGIMFVSDIFHDPEKGKGIALLFAHGLSSKGHSPLTGELLIVYNTRYPMLDICGYPLEGPDAHSCVRARITLVPTHVRLYYPALFTPQSG